MLDLCFHIRRASGRELSTEEKQEASPAQPIAPSPPIQKAPRPYSRISRRKRIPRPSPVSDPSLSARDPSFQAKKTPRAPLRSGSSYPKCEKEAFVYRGDGGEWLDLQGYVGQMSWGRPSSPGFNPDILFFTLISGHEKEGSHPGTHDDVSVYRGRVSDLLASPQLLVKDSSQFLFSDDFFFVAKVRDSFLLPPYLLLVPPFLSRIRYESCLVPCLHMNNEAFEHRKSFSCSLRHVFSSCFMYM